MFSVVLLVIFEPSTFKRFVCSRQKKSNDSICTKRSSKHCALLPGIFTLFCKHGTLLYVVYGGIQEGGGGAYVIGRDLCPSH